ncbi:uncharacterized mitochondrial protein ymf40 isoform X1 [Physcomitrium patens]|uniref:Domain X domain-containing protein n=1 Tax=Physcomitrium patens TaxID=3218 RepID=A0A2K1JDH8_PHYPA|nr:uncharacterized protein LOC112292086 isoform X1 [Physcomitrium patens]PNR39586.1 hypothetical protein PHYPA_019865 [Physcomitrium patens]|eukprot:XP_024396002.1 uncharacterized protein LOC112292086 isoform X1 [Physcomitrella patens]
MLGSTVRRFGLAFKSDCKLGLAEVFLEDRLFRKQMFGCFTTVTERDFDRQETPGTSLNRPNFESDENKLWFCKYSTFFDPRIYEASYRNLRRKVKRKTKVIDDTFSQSTIVRVIQQMRDRSFQFQPVKKETITTADGTHIPVGTPSFSDQVVQEAMRFILEPVFVNSRPDENSAQATLQRVRNWTGTTWLITDRTPGLLNNLDHSLLGNLLMRGVKDQQLHDLYWKLVNAGLVATINQERHNLTGVSKGGILWPLFTNVYLSEFDVRLKEFASSMSKSLPTKKDKGTKVHYIRYGDRWVVGVDGPKSLAVEAQNKIVSYLNDILKLKIDSDSITISHLPSEKVNFLGVLVGARDKKYVESLVGRSAERAYGRIFLEAPINDIVEKLVDQGFAVNPEWPRGMSAWIHLEAEEILRRYRNIMTGLMEYYSIVDNNNMMRRVFWLLRFSAIFTLCRKWRMSTRALFRKLANDPQYEDLLKGRLTSSRR